MKLWTWHKPDFSLVAGRVDHRKSEYFQTDGIPEAHATLAACTGTDQIIWCYTLPNQRPILPCRTEQEWFLDVPPEEILCFVDEIVWNRVLGIRCAVPNGLRFRWKNEAIARFPHDIDARHKHQEELADQFWDQSPPGRTWWESLFVEPQPGETISALVRHPIRHLWILRGPTEPPSVTPGA